MLRGARWVETDPLLRVVNCVAAPIVCIDPPGKVNRCLNHLLVSRMGVRNPTAFAIMRFCATDCAMALRDNTPDEQSSRLRQPGKAQLSLKGWEPVGIRRSVSHFMRVLASVKSVRIGQTGLMLPMKNSTRFNFEICTEAKEERRRR